MDKAGRLTNPAVRYCDENQRTEGEVGRGSFPLEDWQKEVPGKTRQSASGGKGIAARSGEGPLSGDLEEHFDDDDF